MMRLIRERGLRLDLKIHAVLTRSTRSGTVTGNILETPRLAKGIGGNNNISFPDSVREC